MKQKGKRTLTPRLRFPEFRDEPGWKEKSVNTISDVNPNHEGLPDLFVYIDLESVEQGKLVAQKIINRESAPSRAQRVLRKQDVIYQTVRPYQRNNLFFDIEDGRDYVASTGYAQLRAYVSPTFLFQLLHTNNFVNRVLAKCTGSNYPAISPSDLAAIEVEIPSPAEQQKIADCLGSLDGLIAAEGRKLTALRDHKRGLMQQLFPQPGQTQPRLRFPEFRDKGEWVEKPLGEIAEIKLGKMLDKNKHRSGHLLPYLNNLSVRWNDFDISDLPKMYFNENELEKYELKKGDVIVCEGGEPGRAAVWDERLQALKFQKALHRVRFKIRFVPHLLVHYLEMIAGTPSFESLFTGGGIKHLTRETFARLAIPIASPAEQQRIADCLAFLDTQLTAQSEKIDALNRHKRGLMQQLFPEPEEMGI